MTPFPPEKMTALYGAPEGYARKVAQRADELVAQRWYLPADAETIKAEAAEVRW